MAGPAIIDTDIERLIKGMGNGSQITKDEYKDLCKRILNVIEGIEDTVRNELDPLILEGGYTYKGSFDDIIVQYSDFIKWLTYLKVRFQDKSS